LLSILFPAHLQVAITLTLTRVLGKVFSYMHQPQVIGEIIAGIFLGPSVLGRIPGDLFRQKKNV
jgi:Kef-type K+ transport system membrane component KefB